MTLSNVKDTKYIEVCLDNIVMESHYESEDEKPPRHSKSGQNKDL